MLNVVYFNHPAWQHIWNLGETSEYGPPSRALFKEIIHAIFELNCRGSMEKTFDVIRVEAGRGPIDLLSGPDLSSNLVSSMTALIKLINSESFLSFFPYVGLIVVNSNCEGLS
jgi:hypothetical protein